METGKTTFISSPSPETVQQNRGKQSSQIDSELIVSEITDEQVTSSVICDSETPAKKNHKKQIEKFKELYSAARKWR